MGITFGMQVKVPDIQNTILFEIVFKNISSKCYDAIFFYSLLFVECCSEGDLNYSECCLLLKFCNLLKKG